LRRILVALLLSSVAIAGIIHISSDFVSPEEDTITYSGSVSVLVEEDNLSLRCATLTVNKKEGDWRDMEAEGEVFIKTEDIEAMSEKLKYDVKEKEGSLIGNAIAYLPESESTVMSDSISFDLDEKLYWSKERSTFMKGEVVATSNEFTYDGSKVNFKGDFVAVKGKHEIFGSEAELDLDEDFMIVKSGARIVTEEATVDGDELFFDMEKEGTLTGNVRAEVVRKDTRVRLESKYLKFNTDEGRYEGWGGRVKMWKGRVYSEADRFVYEKEGGVVRLSGSVFIDDPEKGVKIWAEKVFIYLDEDRMEAFKARTEIKME